MYINTYIYTHIFQLPSAIIAEHPRRVGSLEGSPAHVSEDNSPETDFLSEEFLSNLHQDIVVDKSSEYSTVAIRLFTELIAKLSEGCTDCLGMVGVTNNIYFLYWRQTTYNIYIYMYV